MLEEKQLHVIGVATGLGAPDHHCARAPEVIWGSLAHPLLHWGAILQPSANGAATEQVGKFSRLLSDAVSQACSSDSGRVVVIGGDHSCAIGTWRGVAQAAGGTLGLIWLDAHMDAHTRDSSPSGYWHGMPVANLLGCDGALFGNEKGVIAPENLTMIGVRSFEPEEKALLDGLGVKIFTDADLHRVGFEAAMEEARQRARNGTVGYGMSIDLDGLNLADAPGVGSPVVGGFRATELLAALSRFRSDTDMLTVEIAEFNPVVDVEKRTRKLIQTMLETLIGVGCE